MTSLFLIRHGQTDWNRQRRVQGLTDIPLNDTGRAQARDAATRLRERLGTGGNIAIVSSDLSRARETAEIIAEELGLPAPRTYSQLRERGYGQAEGLSIDDLAARWGRGIESEIPDAEAWSVLQERAIGALGTVVSDLREATAPAPASALVVAHGALIRAVLRHASAGTLPADGQRIENGSFHELRYERDHVRLVSHEFAAV